MDGRGRINALFHLCAVCHPSTVAQLHTSNTCDALDTVLINAYAFILLAWVLQIAT